MPKTKKAKIWTTEHLWFATDAASIALWRWNVDTDVFDMDQRAPVTFGASFTKPTSILSNFLRKFIQPTAIE